MPEISRRVFLKLAGGTGAAIAAGLAGKSLLTNEEVPEFSKSTDKLIAYVEPPRESRPGVWSIYATTCRECPAGCGMHVRCQDGRVVKAEGNPGHPLSRSGLCPRGQSAVQGLYDPDRLKTPLRRDAGGKFVPVTWADALEEIGRRLAEGAKVRGKVGIISDLQTGTLEDVMEQFVAPAGQHRRGWKVFYELMGGGNWPSKNGVIFGKGGFPNYRLADCDFILSLSADFLETWISPVQYARDFAQMHAYRDGKVGRFVYAGPRRSMTAANADEFIPLRPGAEGLLALAVVHAIIAKGWSKADVKPVERTLKSFDLAAAISGCGVSAEKIESLAKEFVEAKASVALAGPAGGLGLLPITAGIGADLLNYVAGRIGQTVDFSRMHALSRAEPQGVMDYCWWAPVAKQKPRDVLIVLNTNPAYSMPGWAQVLRRAGTAVYMGTMMDETAELADFVLPIDSPLESWGDYEPQIGVHCLIQPAMRRLYDTRNAGDIFLALAELAGKPLSPATMPLTASAPASAPLPPTGDKSSQDLVGFEARLHQRWKDLHQRISPGKPFEQFWHDALQVGGAWETPPAEEDKLEWTDPSDWLGAQLPPVPQSSNEADLWAYPSIMLYDGRTANRSWLQEAPDPMSYATWGSWVDIHPTKAAALGIRDGDIIELKNGKSAIEAPARVTDQVHPDVVAMAMGQGHTALGRNAAGRGANVFSLVTGGDHNEPFGQVTLRKTGKNIPLAVAAFTQEQHERNILQWVDLADLRKMKPGEGDNLALPLPEGYRPEKDLYPPREYKEHRWAMVVDLQKCIGCGACSVACYAENNIPVVGEERVRRAGEMPWLQVVPYEDSRDRRRVGFLPMMCQHCDAAPCEPVCPVFASVHNEEGLNAQVYNRCIGTRYCSNNCPYKVRRFNWVNIQWEKPLDVQLNPDVTVRSRGVMEKCTFCIQRLREAQALAKRQGRAVRDGDVQPACVQSCPTRAYTFGDLLDDDSQVSQLTRRDPRRYQVLGNLNTKPAVTYLRRIRQ